MKTENEFPIFKFFNLGCKVNQYDGALIIENLQVLGLRLAEQDEEPDFIIINTCSVTANADKKSRQLIGSQKSKFPNSKIIVTGCYAEAEKKKLSEMDSVSAVFGTQERDCIEKYILSDYTIKNRNYPCDSFRNRLSIYPGKTRAFVKIQDGCDHFCSYCRVPFVRGNPFSRNPDDIQKEIESLVNSGKREIVFCGIRLGQYLWKDVTLTKLMRSTKGIQGLIRLRLSSLEPLDITDDIISEISYGDMVCNHLHIPLQSGSNKILQLMKRGYSAEQYTDIIEKIKNACKDIMITTDLIVGFPNESEKDFEDSLTLAERCSFSKTHIFRFSIRNETEASNLPNKIDRTIIKQRAERAIARTTELAMKIAQNQIGKIKQVLFETFTLHKGEKYLSGTSSDFFKIKVPCIKTDKNILNMERINLLAQICEVRIEHAEFEKLPILYGHISE